MKINKAKSKIAVVFLILFFSSSCKNNDVYLNYQTIAPKGWSKDSIYRFDIPIRDTAASYNVYVNVRNVGEYPYQNLWLFLSTSTPSKYQQNDTIECYLADQRGKWIGSGIGSTYEMSVLYQQNIRFDTAGVYVYKIVQGMRDTVLKGINDIGIRVEKNVLNQTDEIADGKK